MFDYAEGDRYRGEFKASRKHGKGVYVWPNGDRWVSTLTNHHPPALWVGIDFLLMDAVSAPLLLPSFTGSTFLLPLVQPVRSGVRAFLRILLLPACF